MNELRRHIYADSVDRHTIRKLLQRVFVPCKCEKYSAGTCHGSDFSAKGDDLFKECDTGDLSDTGGCHKVTYFPLCLFNLEICCLCYLCVSCVLFH